jgi:hypothetical protein
MNKQPSYREFASLEYPLSNFDIQDAFDTFKDHANIQSEDQITSHTPLENIWKDKGHVVIFKRWPNQRVGHWYVCLRDRNHNCFIFDSLANKPPKKMIEFLKNNGFQSIKYNKMKMQGSTSVCGRYAILGALLNKMNLPLDAFYKFFENGKKQAGSFDKFVLNITTTKK